MIMYVIKGVSCIKTMRVCSEFSVLLVAIVVCVVSV